MRNIRANVITLITPVLEVDGREKQVDTYYFNKRRAPGDVRLPLVYWGRYVAHDNNRDGIGQYLELTRAVTSTTLDWHPTVVHDLHETQAYLYVSTGTGPYNPELDPIVPHEWWTLADNDVREMTRRGVPGVWTWAYYDGWMPNYMFFIAHTHNAIGRFYEVQGYGPDPYTVRLDRDATSREWFRPLPPAPTIKWGPRNTVNIEQSALLLSLQHVADHRETYLDNYWLKNRRSVERGRTDPPFAWVIPAGQRRGGDAADAVNDLRRQGLEISVASSSFGAGGVSVKAGDFIVRADQPFRTLAAMYFAIQRFPAGAQAYDDTGWTFQLLRDIAVIPVDDASILNREMTPLDGEATARGGVLEGTGPFLVVEHTADTHLAVFRFRNANVKMNAAEQDFEITTASGPRENARRIDRDPERGSREPGAAARGARSGRVGAARGAGGRDARPRRAAHRLRPQLDPNAGRRLVARGVRRVRRSVHVLRRSETAGRKPAREIRRHRVSQRRRDGASQVSGIAAERQRAAPVQANRRNAQLEPAGLERRHSRRHGPGGCSRAREVRAPGRDVADRRVDGGACFPRTALPRRPPPRTSHPTSSTAAVLRGVFTDRRSPIAYGYDKADLPVYFNQTPLLSGGLRASERSAARGDAVSAKPGRHPALGIARERPAAVESPAAGRRADRERPPRDVCASARSGAGRRRAPIRWCSTPF